MWDLAIASTSPTKRLHSTFFTVLPRSKQPAKSRHALPHEVWWSYPIFTSNLLIPQSLPIPSPWVPPRSSAHIPASNLPVLSSLIKPQWVHHRHITIAVQQQQERKKPPRFLRTLVGLQNCRIRHPNCRVLFGGQGMGAIWSAAYLLTTIRVLSTIALLVCIEIHDLGLIPSQLQMILVDGVQFFWTVFLISFFSGSS